MLSFLHDLPDPFERFLVGVSQFVAVVYPLIIVIAFGAARRVRAALVCVAAGIAAAAVVWCFGRAIDIDHPSSLAVAQRADSWIVGSGFPDHVYVGVASALAVVVGAYAGLRWRHVAWTFVGTVIVFRIVSGTEGPFELGIALAAGWACGDLTLLAFGSPTRQPTGHDIVTALARSSLAVRRLARASVDARGSTPWFATTADGERLFMKVLGRDQRDADLLFRRYRYARLKRTSATSVRSRACGVVSNTRRSSHSTRAMQGFARRTCARWRPYRARQCRARLRRRSRRFEHGARDVGDRARRAEATRVLFCDQPVAAGHMAAADVRSVRREPRSDRGGAAERARRRARQRPRVYALRRQHVDQRPRVVQCRAAGRVRRHRSHLRRRDR